MCFFLKNGPTSASFSFIFDVNVDVVDIAASGFIFVELDPEVNEKL